jgi:ribonuclease P protein component
MKVFILKKRKDFLKAAKGYKVVTNGLILQAALSFFADKKDCCFVGYTTSKKIGKATVRNFVRRRLRAIVQKVMPENALAGVNYVLVGRYNTAELNFEYLSNKIKNAVIEINQQILEKEKKYVKKSDDTVN